MRATRLRSVLSVLSLLSVLAGCGPVRSTSVLIDAEVQLQAARTAGAEQRAPYEFTAATLYLHKAREEVGYSQYEVGMALAEKALSYATQAKEAALAQVQPEAPPPLPASPAAQPEPKPAAPTGEPQ